MNQLTSFIHNIQTAVIFPRGCGNESCSYRFPIIARARCVSDKAAASYYVWKQILIRQKELRYKILFTLKFGKGINEIDPTEIYPDVYNSGTKKYVII